MSRHPDFVGDTADFVFRSPPPPAGRYVLGESPYLVVLPMARRPRRLHRLMMRLAFGVRWENER